MIRHARNGLGWKEKGGKWVWFVAVDGGGKKDEGKGKESRMLTLRIRHSDAEL